MLAGRQINSTQLGGAQPRIPKQAARQVSHITTAGRTTLYDDTTKEGANVLIGWIQGINKYNSSCMYSLSTSLTAGRMFTELRDRAVTSRAAV